jgi:hypothetical protein
MARAKKEVEEKGKTLIEISDKMVGVSKEEIDETSIEEIQDSIPEPEMEVKKKSEPEPRKKLRWKKLGGGSLRRVPGYPIVKPGQIFEAFLDDISPRFLPTLQCLDAELMAEQVGKRLTPAPKETTWKAESKKVTVDKKSVIIWNVVNSISGKPINEIPLSEADANKLAVALNN